jgi:hypothetical protein
MRHHRFPIGLSVRLKDRANIAGYRSRRAIAWQVGHDLLDLRTGNGLGHVDDRSFCRPT